MSKLRSSLLLSYADRYSQLVITFVASVILSRLLVPEEIGLFSVAATMTVIAHMVRDFGVSNFIVQEDKLSDERLISAFLVTVFWSYTIAATLFLSAGAIADFFSRPEVEKILHFTVLNFLIIPFGSVSLSLLRKAMNFNALLRINVASVLGGAITSIALAYNGFSYMSLVYASLVSTSITVLLSSLYRRKIALVKPSRESIKTVFLFGSKSSYINIITVAAHQLPEIIIGRMFGMTSVGLYSRAGGLIKMFHQAVLEGIVPVLLPHFAQQIQKSGDISADYIKFQSFICIISWSFFVFLSIMAHDIILLLFGPNWTAAAPMVLWLAIAAAVIHSYAINAHVLLALKQINTDVKIQTWSQIITVGILLVAATFGGITGLLIGMVIGRFIGFLIADYYLCRVSDIKPSAILSALTKPLIIAAVGVALLLLITSLPFFDDLALLLRLAFTGSLFTLNWLFLNKVLNTGLLDTIFSRAQQAAT